MLKIFKLANKFSTFLIASRVEDLKKRYPNIDIDALVAQDPSQNNKYLQWMAAQLSNGYSIEDLAKVILYFHRNA